MALSSVSYTGNGSTTQFAVPYQYLFPTDVTATVNGTLTAFTFVNPGLVAFSPAPGAGTLIIITRHTNIATLDVEFVDGSTVQASDINTAELQALYLAQEANDSVSIAVAAADLAQAAAVAANTAVTTLTTTVNAAVTAANAATASANAAVTAVNAALASIPATVKSTLTGLPTSLPATAGQLWIDGGVIAIS